MKKLKFAAQIVLLAAAFPVLFIAGITQPVKRPEERDECKKEIEQVRKAKIQTANPDLAFVYNSKTVKL